MFIHPPLIHFLIQNVPLRGTVVTYAAGCRATAPIPEEPRGRKGQVLPGCAKGCRAYEGHHAGDEWGGDRGHSGRQSGGEGRFDWDTGASSQPWEALGLGVCDAWKKTLTGSARPGWKSTPWAGAQSGDRQEEAGEEEEEDQRATARPPALSPPCGFQELILGSGAFSASRT